MKNILSFSLLASTLLLISCGGGSSGGSTETSGKQQDELIAEGSYKAFLRPMNTHIYGTINSGVADVKIVGTDVKMNIIMDDAAGVTHMQSLHLGSECPTKAQDFNNDSYVDINETMKTAGEIQYPLDYDISSIEKGAKSFPMGRSYTYKESASIKEMRTNHSGEISFENRVVIIYGAPASANLPISIAKLDGKSIYASIPIACGVLKKI